MVTALTGMGMALTVATAVAAWPVAAQTSAQPAQAASTSLPAPSIATLVKPDASVPATPKSGSEWERQASALIQREKLKHADELHAAAAKPKPTASDYDQLTTMAKGSADIISHPEKVVGTQWLSDADARQATAERENAATLRTMTNRTPTAMQEQLDKAAQTLGMESPTGDGLAAKMKAEAAAKRRPVHYRLFVSQSMGDEAVRMAMLLGKGHDDMQIVFRGMKPGQTIGQLSRYLMSLHKKAPKMGERLPSIVIDPVYFTQEKVSAVPVLEELDDQGKVVARVAGVADPSWIDGQVQDGHTGDLGTMGPVLPVSELDMMKVMQAKAKAFDVERWKKHAVDSYWQKVPFTDLPLATEQKTYTVDPTVVVTQDVVLPNGTVLAHKGDTFNPLKEIGFHQKLLIFDETDPVQVDYAEAFLKANPDITVMLITTKVDRQGSWKGYRDTENKMRHAIYMLNQTIVNTWKLQAVPSVVTANSSVFVINEVPVHQGGSNVADYASPR